MRRIRRAVGAAGLVVALVVGTLALTEQPSAAATTWYVATTGNNASTCTAPATPCLTLPGVFGKPAFASGDTVNVAPGTHSMAGAAQRVTVTRTVTIQRDPAVPTDAGDVIFDGGDVAGGSLFFVNGAGIELTLRDLTVRRGNGGTSGFGAALLVFNGSATAEGVTFDANRSAAGFGGAVAVWPGATFTHTGGGYTNNSAANGGAVASFGAAPSLAAASVSIADVRFSGNTAPGGALAATGNGGAIYNSGTASVVDSTFTGNGVAQSTNANSRRGYGGSIFNGPTDAADAPELTLVRTSFGGVAPPAALGTHATSGGAIANVGLVGSTAGGTSPGRLVAEQVTVTGATAIFGGGIYSSGPAELVGGSIDDNRAVPLAGLVFSATGGGIFSTGSLELTGTALRGNTVAAAAGTQSTGLGGALYSQTGSLDLIDAVLTDNTAAGSAAAATGLGGAIFTFGSPVELVRTALERNDATGTGANGGSGGGAYLLGGATTITDSTVAANHADAVGGGLYVAGTTGVAGGAVSANSAATGGGIYAGAATTLDGTVVDGNAAALAAGVYNASTLTATGTSLSGNTATDTGSIGSGSGGGLYNSGTATFTGGEIADNTAAGGGAPATGLGGGIFNGTGTARVSLDGVRVTGNAATGSSSVFQTGWGGAIYNGVNTSASNSDVVVERSTLDGNRAVFGSVLVAFAPGAASSADTSVRRSTVSGNATTTPGGAALLVSTGSHLTVTESTLAGADTLLVAGGNATANVSGSVLTGAPAACSVQASASLVDGGHNLVDAAGGPGCGFAGTTVVGDPALGPLDPNGGATPTHLPGPASAALDRIDPGTASGVDDAVSGAAITLCVEADQRGVVRPQGARCDIGSVEAGQEAPSVAGPEAGSFVVGSSGTLGEYAATGAPLPTLTASGLPSGLTFQVTGAGTGSIIGTPAPGTGGAHLVTVTATNDAGSASLDVEVTVNEAPTLAGPAQLHLVEGVAGSAGYTATGHPTPALSVEGPLPAGVTFTPAADGTATIGGTPTAGSAGTYTVVVTASNGTAPAAVQTVTIEVDPLLAITTEALPSGSVGVPYGAGVAVAGGTAPYGFEVTTGALPAGLVLGDDGAITGIPSGLPGTSTFTVTVTDSTDPTAQVAARELSITIGAGPSFLDVSPVILQRTLLGINIGSVNATLRGGIPGQPLANQTVVFRAGNHVVCSAVTDADGYVSCSMTVGNTLRTILSLGVTGTYAGSDRWLPSSDSAGLL